MIFLDIFFEKCSISNFVKIRPVGDELFRGDRGRTDGHEANVAFRNFGNPPKNRFKSEYVILHHFWNSQFRNPVRKSPFICTLWVCVFARALQRPNSGLGHLIAEVPRLHTIRHTTPTRLLWTSDQTVALATTYTTHNKHNSQISIPKRGFEPAIPTIDGLQTYALYRTATRIGLH
jgi:hypothetical protein